MFFLDTVLFLSRPSWTNKAGTVGWLTFVSILSDDIKSEAPHPFRRYITWNKGAGDTNLPLLTHNGQRVKTPLCSLGPADSNIRRLILETGFSEPDTELEWDIHTWLLRPIALDGDIAAVEEHSVQCGFSLKIRKNLCQWLEA